MVTNRDFSGFSKFALVFQISSDDLQIFRTEFNAHIYKMVTSVAVNDKKAPSLPWVSEFLSLTFLLALVSHLSPLLPLGATNNVNWPQ